MKLRVFTTILAAMICASAAAATPVVQWNFGNEETTPLESHGGVHRDVPGPRPPEFPDFEPNNTAVKFDGSGAHFSFADPGTNSPYDFTNNDAITLEAWVKINELKPKENPYVIGKGRTGSPEFASDNQNWALRVRESKGQACVNFLFASTPASGVAKSDAHWHRWTSDSGFAPGSGWHHIAVSYRFGDPKSIRGWIDGKAQSGVWDMGGATTDAPVTDNDAIWIGSSQKGIVSSSLRGSLDAIAIYREALSDEEIRSHCRREAVQGVVVNPEAAAAAKLAPEPEKEPELGVLPAGKVVATFNEGLADNKRWLNENEAVPEETARVMLNEFLIQRLPLRYDAWGIRESWKTSVLLRLAADVQLAPGQHKILLRARGLSRLWINGKVVARTKPVGGSTDGHNPVTPVVPPPMSGVRPVAYGQQESVGEITLEANGKCRVILEILVGGKNSRAEPGETSVAVLNADGKSFSILQPEGSNSPATLLEDDAVNMALARAEKVLSVHDDKTRRALAASQELFWQKRHENARASVRENAAPPLGAGESNVIDAFLRGKIELALAESAKASPEEAKQFHSTVLPILRDGCFRCHGEKEKGGLRLNSRAAALKSGESDKPAVVPGDVAASQLIERIKSKESEERMPPQGDGLKPEQIAILENWIKTGAPWPAPPITREEVAQPAVIGDAAFLRRAYLDTVGVPPSEQEARVFLSSTAGDKRSKLIDALLADERWADHWTSYWQDVLAENPNMLKPSLNNTGPFRWFIYEALRDNKPVDRFVTELIMLRGSEREGGAAGFGMAADNDAPFAAKGHIVANAFLGIELQCARCHDSPYHSTKQRDLYSLAAMFERKTVTVPKSSTVPAAFFEKKARESLIKVTLKPSEPITPTWPFAQTTGCKDDATLNALMMNNTDTRERLAALITAPQNTRFSQVIVNRVWRRLMGAGIVEPPHDWEGHAPSHPEMLAWLAKDWIAHDYDLKYLARTIMNSQAYQRASSGRNLKTSPELRFFAAPERRRLSAEQVVDSLYSAAGLPIDVEEITFDPDGRQAAKTMISLGVPRRAWMFASLSNERDRPSLSLPRAQVVADVMEAFGWTGSRQNPRTDRETDPNVLQPGVLGNSVVSVWITRASNRSALADLAVNAASPEALVDSVFLRFLSRLPTNDERAPFVSALAAGFSSRLVPVSEIQQPAAPPRLRRVTWSNHLMPDATTIKQEMEKISRAGTPPDPRLKAEWREVYEDVVWSVINTREFVWVP